MWPPPIPLELLLGGKGPLPVGIGWACPYALSLWLNSLVGTPACIAVPALESLRVGIPPPIDDLDDSLRNLYVPGSRVGIALGGGCAE